MSIEKLLQGKSLSATMLRMISNPSIIRIVKNAGLDCVILDLEHGAYSMGEVAGLASVARAIDVVILARVPELSRGYISRVLDCGAQGVMVPMLETVEQAERLVAWAKYPPLGNRGLGSCGVHTDCQSINGAEAFMKRANSETITIAQIETKKAIEAIDQIAAVVGIDMLLVGPNDLAISIGCPGELTTQQMDDAIAKVVEACRKENKLFGMHGGESLLAKWAPCDIGLVVHSTDMHLLLQGLRNIRDTIDRCKEG